VSGLRSEGYHGVGPPVLLPLQLPHEVGGVSGFEAASRESQAFADEFELGGEHLLLLNELAQKVMVLAVAGDVGDDAEVVSGVRGVTELFEVGGSADEHVVEPGGESDGDETPHGRGVDGLAVGTFTGLLVASEPMDTGGVAGVKADEAGADDVAVLPDVEARDEVVGVSDVALRGGVPSFGDLSEVLLEVSDDVLETGDLGSMLGGTGLDGESETVNELAQLLGGNVGMGVEGGEH